mgnify:FL=1
MYFGKIRCPNKVMASASTRRMVLTRVGKSNRKTIGRIARLK